MTRRVTRLILSFALAGAVVVGAAACSSQQKPAPAGNGKNVPVSVTR